ncbi:uncharacterized protein F4807DRAFT_464323 [Annulohypoxylon truncatum]|uniref:uncharacterized protein n=1 Tax=Annulohypoxylon truncatum TaxID=327061 RepID=UPI0020081498|nr:uncharacterized protein F4807DRAFT_464323 [Annulohypoxylon truncatum]KAI1205861.1 hypothetical protein F4807DRAFT_464323 [Annulohypoxylon truncatum]
MADSASISETTNQSSSKKSANRSIFSSNPSTDGRGSTSACSTLDSTPDNISIETVLEKSSLDTGHEPPHEVKIKKRKSQTELSPRELLGVEVNQDNGALRSHISGFLGLMVSQFDHEQDPQDRHSKLDITSALTIGSRSAEDKPESEVQRTAVPYANERSTKAGIREKAFPITPSNNSLVELIESEESLITATATGGKVVPFDHRLEYLPEDSDSESEPSAPSDYGSPIAAHELQECTESEVEYPTIKSKHAAIDGYQVHKHTDFQPGRVFKILWSEQVETKTLAVEGRSSSKFYIGFRRFIIVATEEEGYSTCIPILTYERRGCTKPGVNPKTHGIVYSVSGNSIEREPTRKLKGEPELGFPPIKVDGYKNDEPLPKESRVNYAKLITIEHNVKVFFIGFVPLLDFGKVVHATIECWENNMRKGR